MRSLYGAVGPQLLPEETSIPLEGGRATQYPSPYELGVCEKATSLSSSLASQLRVVTQLH